ISLLKQKLKSGFSKTHYSHGNYIQRSSIPSLLVLDILEQIINNKETN
ncbi:hypothetical protein BCF89_1261, partial [Metamycoplasma auris]